MTSMIYLRNNLLSQLFVGTVFVGDDMGGNHIFCDARVA